MMKSVQFSDDNLNVSRLFLGLCLAQLLLWSFAGIWAYQTAPLDVVEAIAWGQQWQLGYDRDPYLVAWLARIVSLIAGQQVWSMFVLSQVCVVATFSAVWLFARRLGLSQNLAMMSVLFLLGNYYYQFTSPEFNDNVLQLPTWAFCQYFFYKSITDQRSRDWLCFGAFAGLALMAKYFAIMLLVPIGLFVLFTQDGRRSFRFPGLYLAALVFLLVVAPNVYWQYQNDWQYIHYALQRAAVKPSLLGHIGYPLKFLSAQLLAVGPSLLAYLWLTRRLWQRRLVPSILGWLTWGPLCTVLVYSLLTGTQMRSMWGAPLFSLVGLFVVAWSRPTITDSKLRSSFILYLAIWLISLVAFVASILVPPYFMGYSKHAQFPSAQLAQKVDAIWQVRYQRPIAYVAGDRHLSARVAAYSKAHPIPYFKWDQATSPWVDELKMRQQGAIFLWNIDKQGHTLPTAISQRYPGLIQLPVQYFAPTRGVNLPKISVGMAILPPAKTLPLT